LFLFGDDVPIKEGKGKKKNSRGGGGGVDWLKEIRDKGQLKSFLPFDLEVHCAVRGKKKKRGWEGCEKETAEIGANIAQ